ncbi:MamI family restriction endonuclease [Micromonospora sp. C28ISP2-4]|uniref:MamI family restriction endonuclease n=1 Tax=Micromonospora sp. C28ISP2-4 TaxID=3059523 RepID=UPI002674CB70|nr:MamI family restriction endonuclease [Micromonospora sp. C28ISP2-4]MDO3683474.1 MamI family restriction endonuclease [Micromonospora sp. C28ISP2-4]
MKNEVARALEQGVTKRRTLLRSLSRGQQQKLLEDLFIDFFANQHTTLQKWAALTGQSAQVDTGYIAQFVASIVLKEPGQGFRGKGDDLADGSEVKSAANISGVDRPRWNHNLGKPSDDAKRAAKGELPVWQEYLNAPAFFYLLVDRVVGKELPRPIRVRAWALDAQKDQAWRQLVKTFVQQRISDRYNLQLHPPVGYDDSIVVNTLGNLDLANVLVFDARIVAQPGGRHAVRWEKPLPDEVLPVTGRSRAVPYGGRTARPSRLTDAADLVADIAVIPNLFPGVFDEKEESILEEVSREEAEA